MRINEARKVRAERESLGGFVQKASNALQSLYKGSIRSGNRASIYSGCLRCIVQMLGVLIAAERMQDNSATALAFRRCAEIVRLAVRENSDSIAYNYQKELDILANTARVTLFANQDFSVNPEALSAAARMLLMDDNDSIISPIYFQTVPLTWLGRAYQHMLTLRSNEEGDLLVRDNSRRKGNGVYFTPPPLVDYITESVLGELLESASAFDTQKPIRVMDPSMGGGDFLIRTVEYLGRGLSIERNGKSSAMKAYVAENCVYGSDIDPLAADIARFCVWAASGFSEDVVESINRNLVCADVLDNLNEEHSTDWSTIFPSAFDGISTGFDAVVGNPPYIASKNGLKVRAGSGQGDSYLLFLSAVMRDGIVRKGGLLAMVLPDPMLVRSNAATIRRKLISEWTLDSVLHISGAFPEAHVANIVPIARNNPPRREVFSAVRIDKADDRRRFTLDPRRTAREVSQPVRMKMVLAQERWEMLYLLENGEYRDIVHRIHGPNSALTNYIAPFTPLEKLNIKAIYRGEEIGKASISGNFGDMPILLGGQSISPYSIEWEGRRIGLSKIKKPLERYTSTKILIQKSSAHLVAALDEIRQDHNGYIFPQSVYAIELRKPGMDELYLLCILNSKLMNEYLHRTVTGYKLLQPQIEIEDIRRLPVRRISFTTPDEERGKLATRGIGIFEKESQRFEEAAPFPKLANFAVQCLTGTPEKSDVVHDVLVELGRRMIELKTKSRKQPDASITREKKAISLAIETLVCELYSSEPAQMALPW